LHEDTGNKDWDNVTDIELRRPFDIVSVPTFGKR
jgi:hypothetical protein